MSSLTVVKVREGVFVSQECLEQALLELDLQNTVRIEINERNFAQLTLSDKVEVERVHARSQDLQTKLTNILTHVTPVYARILAIKELEAKGFRVKTKEKLENGETRIIMEREQALTEGGKFERMVVTIHNDNTVTLDAINFTGRSCLKTTGSLETKLGKVKKRELKPEAMIQPGRKTSVRKRQRLRL